MPKTTLRNIRIDDDLWSAAMSKAADGQRSVSEVVRELLTEWITPPRSEDDRATAHR